jgi:exoribonuclease R
MRRPPKSTTPFRCRRCPASAGEVGIHIAAPALGIAPGSPLDDIARERLSTVYLPGSKITMLPDTVVDASRSRAAATAPAISLYLTVTPSSKSLAHESRIEIVPVVANLRHHDIEPLFNEQTIADGLPEFPFRDELLTLWQLANACEGRRGKPSAMQGNSRLQLPDRRRSRDAEACRVEIRTQARQPARQTGRRTDDRRQQHLGRPAGQQGRAAIYRVQTGGKVRMSTSPQAHEGLGVKQYAWSSSPLRRYVDLLNQWQLIACLNGETPPFAARSDACSRPARFRADLQRLRRIPAQHGTLLVSALAAPARDGHHRGDDRPRESGQTRPPASGTARAVGAGTQIRPANPLAHRVDRLSDAGSRLPLSRNACACRTSAEDATEDETLEAVD